MFVVGLERRLLAETEELGRRALLIPFRGPVVVGLMVIPHWIPGGCGMRGLEIGIGFVLGIAPPIVVDTEDFAGEVATVDQGSGRRRRGRRTAILVDVVAIAEYEIRLGGGKMPVGGVEARLVVLAASDGEGGARRWRSGRRRCFRATDRALDAAGAESIPVGPRG